MTQNKTSKGIDRKQMYWIIGVTVPFIVWLIGEKIHADFNSIFISFMIAWAIPTTLYLRTKIHNSG